MNRHDWFTLLRGDSPLLKADAGRGPCPFPATRVIVIRTHGGEAIELWLLDAQGQAISFEPQPTMEAAKGHAQQQFEWETLEWKRVPRSAHDPFAYAMAAQRGAAPAVGPLAIWARLRGLFHRAA